MASPSLPGGRDELSRSLRELRKHVGLGQIEAAAAVRTSQAGLSRIETGRSLPSPDTVAALARIYQATEEQTARLVALAEAIRPEHLDSRIIMQRGVNHFQQRLSKIEKSAALIRAFQPAIILGILQTPAYASVVFSARGRTSQQTAEGVAARLGRQPLLAEPGRQWILLQGAGALDWCVRDPQLMVEQLEHIAELTQLPNVRFGVIPRKTPAGVLAPHGFHIYDQRAVQIGTKTATALIDEASDITVYNTLFSELEKLAVFGDDVRALLHRTAGDYRKLTTPE